SVMDGIADSRTFRVWAEVENEKVVDAVTKQSFWKIQPGSPANMTIDLTPPPPPKPAIPTKTDAKGTTSKTGTQPGSNAPAGSGSKPSPGDGKSSPAPSASGKVDALKPAVGGADDKSTGTKKADDGKKDDAGKKDDGKTPGIQASPAKGGDGKNPDVKSAS